MNFNERVEEIEKLYKANSMNSYVSNILDTYEKIEAIKLADGRNIYVYYDIACIEATGSQFGLMIDWDSELGRQGLLVLEEKFRDDDSLKNIGEFIFIREANKFLIEEYCLSNRLFLDKDDIPYEADRCTALEMRNFNIAIDSLEYLIKNADDKLSIGEFNSRIKYLKDNYDEINGEIKECKKVDAFIEKYDNCISYIQDIIANSKYETIIEIEDKELKNNKSKIFLLYDDVALRAYGGSGGLLKPFYTAKKWHGLIILEEKFKNNKKLENIKKAVVYHEIGHFVNSKDNEPFQYGTDEYIKEEMMADEFSASVLGCDIVLESLNYFKDDVNSNDRLNIIDKRIKNIEMLKVKEEI